MGYPINKSKEFEVVIDGGNRVEIVKGATADIDGHGYLDIRDEHGMGVAIFAKFDHVISKPAEQE